MSANFSKKMPNSLPWKWSMISEPNLILFSITLIGWTISQRAGMHNIVFPLLVGVFLYVMYYVWEMGSYLAPGNQVGNFGL